MAWWGDFQPDARDVTTAGGDGGWVGDVQYSSRVPEWIFFNWRGESTCKGGHTRK